jgi:sarcosine oxidase, subunit beta
MIEGASVVVVGAGVTGLSTAFWLAEAGVDVLVLDRNPVGREASGRNGGGCAHHASPLFPEEQRLWPMMSDLLGYPTEFVPHQIGLTFSEERHRLYRRALDNAAHHGMQIEELDARQVREMVPLAGDNVYGGYYYHFGGKANPHRTVQAYAWAVRDRGGRVRQGVAVTGFETAGDRVTAVKTAQGVISCDHVVIAAGPQTTRLAAMLGVHIPTRVARAEMIVTEPLPLQPHTGVDGNGLYGRQTLRGNLAYGGGPHEWVDTEDDPGGQRPSSPIATSIVRRLAELLPGAANARIIRSWAGLIENTPDGRPVLDRPDAWRNLTVGTMSGVGFGLSPASGRALMQLVTTARCDFADLTTLRLDRFADLEPDWDRLQGWLPARLLAG